jgi:hypothetical protein
VAHAHHAALLPIVDGIVALAEELEAPGADFRSRLAEEYRLITGQLIPHMEQAEATLYPELERLMQNRHSMTPMRREHRELRGLIDELGKLADQELWFGARLRLRRVLYRMYAILKIHLAEEQAYVDVLDRNLSDEEQAELARAMDHAMAGPSPA